MRNGCCTRGSIPQWTIWCWWRISGDRTNPATRECLGRSLLEACRPRRRDESEGRQHHTRRGGETTCQPGEARMTSSSGRPTVYERFQSVEDLADQEAVRSWVTVELYRKCRGGYSSSLT